MAHTLLPLLLCALTLNIAYSVDHGNGTIFVLVVDDKMADFNCYTSSDLVRKVSWSYCRDWTGDNCDTLWSVDAKDIRNQSALIPDRFGKKTEDLMSTLTIMETAKGTCQAGSLATRLDIRSSVRYIGYYVCTFHSKKTDNDNVFAVESLHTRFAVVLPVRWRILERSYGRATLQFAVTNAPDVLDAGAEIYVHRACAKCSDLVASMSGDGNAWTEDYVKIDRQWNNDSVVYTVEMSKMPDTNVSLVFRLLMNRTTEIAKLYVTVPHKPAEYVRKLVRDITELFMVYTLSALPDIDRLLPFMLIMMLITSSYVHTLNRYQIHVVVLFLCLIHILVFTDSLRFDQLMLIMCLLVHAMGNRVSHTARIRLYMAAMIACVTCTRTFS